MGNILNGKDFIIYMQKGGKMVPVCCGRDLEISISSETKEATKMPQSTWKSFYYGDLSYSISASSIVTIDESFNANDFIGMISFRQPLKFMARHGNGTNLLVHGTIILTSVNISGSYRDVMTYSISGVGDGPLRTDKTYYETILTDGLGNPLTDGEGNTIGYNEYGSEVPINHSVDC